MAFDKGAFGVWGFGLLASDFGEGKFGVLCDFSIIVSVYSQTVTEVRSRKSEAQSLLS